MEGKLSERKLGERERERERKKNRVIEKKRERLYKIRDIHADESVS